MNAAPCIRFYQSEDRPALEALYRAVYGDAWRAHTRVGWYIDQPLAAAGSAVAVVGEKIVAAQPFCDLPLHTPWGSQRATLFLDVATHPEHRRQGLFRRVVAAARTAAFERGACLAMTTPNRTAFQGFQRMPEWGRLCTLDCLLVPIGAGAGVQGAGSSVLRRTHNRRIEQDVARPRAGLRLAVLSALAPDAAYFPAAQVGRHDDPRPIGLWQVAPRRPRAGEIEDGLDPPPIAHPGDS